MNSIAKLIKSKTISFNEMMIRHYKKLGLNETETMVLMHLYMLQEEASVLSASDIKDKVSISENDVSNIIVNLIQKGFIDLSIDDSGKETYNLDPVIEGIGNIIEGNSKNENNKVGDVQEITSYIETSFGRVLNSNDLKLVNEWINQGYNVEEIKEAVILSLRAKKTHLKYVDAILSNHHREREKVTVVDEEMKQLLDTVYVKRR